MSSNSVNHPHQKPILVLLAGRTFPEISQSDGDFDDWIAQELGEQNSLIRMDAREIETLPSPAEIAGVVVSGSHAMVTERLPWSECLAQWLKSCVDASVPVLGICYGHQVLAHACGGVVDYHPEGIEIGTRTIQLSESAQQDLLFAQMPSEFPAQLVHSQSVRKLPADAVLLASGEHEAHQAYRVGNCAWGVQFHPEFSAQAMKKYIQLLEQKLISENCDVQALSSAVVDTPDSAELLRRFAEICNRK
jgi:GMP synthase (glutamine-hydrolysing)